MIKSVSLHRLIKNSFSFFSILAFGIFIQGCSGYDSVSSLKSSSLGFSSESLKCENAPLPEYRTSLLTKVELGYVLADLFPSEVSLNKQILVKASEFSNLNVDKLVDRTIYSESNTASLESEVYLLQLMDLSQSLFDQYALGVNFKSDCAGLAGGCLGYYLNSVVSRLWRRPLLSEEVVIFEEIFKKAVSINEKVNLLFIVAMTSP